MVNYRIEHKEQIKEARGVKLECGCGGVYSKKNQAAHFKSMKHESWRIGQLLLNLQVSER